MIKPWQEIINTAIIGTDKKQVNKQLLPENLVDIIEQLEQTGVEKEDQFLMTASVIYNYRRAGFLPLNEGAEAINVCEPESKSYCSSIASGSLQLALDDENDSLIYYWLLLCSKKEQVVEPEMVPIFLDIAKRNKELRGLIEQCNGKRGSWMSQFNPSWKLSTEKTCKELFDHGKPDERKNALLLWRKEAPDEAREALANTWKAEQAVVKADLLLCLEVNLSKEDEAFLTEVWKEKSQKVKEAALKLLKQIPDSFMVAEIGNFVRPLVTYKKTGALLGLVNKESIALNLDFTLPEVFKSYGIRHIDASKIYTEKETSLFDMISAIPPGLWETYLESDATRILELFDKKEESKKFISAFAFAANTFRNKTWGAILYKSYKKLCYDVVKDFDRSLREEIALENALDNRNIYAFLPEKDEEWSPEFTIALLTKTSQEPHSFTRAYYKNSIHHFPVSIADKLDTIIVSDPIKQNYWENIKEDLKRMLAIKQQIIQSF